MVTPWLTEMSFVPDKLFLLADRPVFSSVVSCSNLKTANNNGFEHEAPAEQRRIHECCRSLSHHTVGSELSKPKQAHGLFCI